MATSTSENSLPPMNTYQQLYYQVFSANLVGGFIGTQNRLQSLAEKLIGSAMSQIPNWKLQWGPKAWKQHPDIFHALTGPDNVWFASTAEGVDFPDGTFNCCMIAIAGTATYSLVDWEQEDFAIQNVEDFDNWVGNWRLETIPKISTGKGDDTKSYCAEGTAFGVYQLLSNKAPSSTPGNEKVLAAFIQKWWTTTPGNKRIVIGGHSLGGALAPTLALGLLKATFWDGGKAPAIVTLPAAGASPGNCKFSDTFQQAMHHGNGFQGDYQTLNKDFYNTLDIVPQAWSTDDNQDRNLDNIINNIYTKSETPERLWNIMQKAVNTEKQRTQKAGTTYIPIVGESFNGTRMPVTSISTLLKSILAQHTTAYHKEIGVGKQVRKVYAESEALVSSGEEEGVQKKPSSVVMQDFPVLRSIPSDGFLAPPPEDDYPWDTILDDEE